MAFELLVMSLLSWKMSREYSLGECFTLLEGAQEERDLL